MRQMDKKTKRFVMTFGLLSVLGLQMSWQIGTGSADMASSDPCENTSLQPRPARCADMKFNGKIFKVQYYNKKIDSAEKAGEDHVVAKVSQASGDCDSMCGEYTFKSAAPISDKDTKEVAELVAKIQAEMTEKQNKSPARTKKASKEKEETESSSKDSKSSSDKIAEAYKARMESCSRDSGNERMTCYMDLLKDARDETNDKELPRWGSADLVKFYRENISPLMKARIARMDMEDDSAVEEGREARDLALEFYAELAGGTTTSAVRGAVMTDINNLIKKRASSVSALYRDRDPSRFHAFEEFRRNYLGLNEIIQAKLNERLELQDPGTRAYRNLHAQGTSALERFINNVSNPTVNMLTKITEGSIASLSLDSQRSIAERLSTHAGLARGQSRFEDYMSIRTNGSSPLSRPLENVGRGTSGRAAVNSGARTMVIPQANR